MTVCVALGDWVCEGERERLDVPEPLGVDEPVLDGVEDKEAVDDELGVPVALGLIDADVDGVIVEVVDCEMLAVPDAEAVLDWVALPESDSDAVTVSLLLHVSLGVCVLVWLGDIDRDPDTD